MAYAWGAPAQSRDSATNCWSEPQPSGMSWWHRFTSPWRDSPAIRTAVVDTIPLLLQGLEARMSAREDETRAELTAAIDGALSAYDAVVAERDEYKAALEQADADKAAAVAAAVAETNEANDNLDADFNAGQVEKLRRLQAQPEPEPEPPVEEPAPSDENA
jgi:hypothetical protein